METTAQLAIAQSIAKKYAWEHGLKYYMDILGQAFEAVNQAEKDWDVSKGKGLMGWAYLKLMGIMASENYQPKQYGAKAQYVRLDSNSDNGDSMSQHEAISTDVDAGQTEDRYIQAIRVKDALRILDAMSPRLQSIVRAKIDGEEFEDGTAELDNRVYTAARASQLAKDLPARVSGQADAESGQMSLFGMGV